MNILEGVTLYLDDEPLGEDVTTHFEALTNASEGGRTVGFTQAQPPRLLVTLYPDLAGEEELSDKLLELLTAAVVPSLMLAGPSGLVSYYLLEEPLDEEDWQRLGEAVAGRHGGTPAAPTEILPLPGLGGNTLLHRLEAPLSHRVLAEAYPVRQQTSHKRASARTREGREDNPHALREAIEKTDLPALVAHHYPESGAKLGVPGAVKATWRGDENPSFSLFRSEKGDTWLYRDHATGETGNSFGFLVDILGLDKGEAAEVLKGGTLSGSAVLPQAPAPKAQEATQKKPREKGRVVETYAYTDEGYNLLFEVVRYEPKRFVQRVKEGARYTYKLGDTRRVLYHLPRLVAAKSAGETVYLVEGEKDVHTLEAYDFTATCNPMGALKWRDEYTEALRGAKVIILPDNDETGEKHAELVSEALHGVAASVAVVKLPGLSEHGDVTDWFAAGGTAEGLKELVAPRHEVSEASYEEMQHRLWELVNTGAVPSFIHPQSRCALSPENARYCLQDALEKPKERDSQRVISEAYGALQGTPLAATSGT